MAHLYVVIAFRAYPREPFIAPAPPWWDVENKVAGETNKPVVGLDADHCGS
ncbi:MAG: hypothetical protein ACREPY_02280 [Rhodanobacteraceae bacterium]